MRSGATLIVLAALSFWGRTEITYADAAAGPAVERARSVISAKLKDPASAEFSGIVERDSRDFSGRQVKVICGKVRAKNSFGGYESAKDFYVIDGRGYIFDGKRISQDLIDEFVDAESWKRFCK